MRSETKRAGGPVLGVILAAMLIASVPRASAWQYTLNGTCAIESILAPDQAWSVVVNSAGDVIAGGSIGVNPWLSDGLVVKFSGQLGAPSVLWQTRLTSDSPTPWNEVTRVALDEAENVLVAGVRGGLDENLFVSAQLMVAKLDGATGSILWQQEVFPPNGAYGLDTVTAVAADAAGNVIAAGIADPEADGTRNSAVVKLDGVTGGVLWQATGPNGSYFTSVAIDHANNVLVAGSEGGAAVAKYDGGSGTELWVVVDGFDEFRAVAVDASNNVVVAGRMALPEVGFKVRKLDTNGADVWSFSHESRYGASALILDGAGNVFAAGTTTALNPEMAAFKLDGDTGAVLWGSNIDQGTFTAGYGLAIALDPSGTPVVGGMFSDAGGVVGFTRGAMAIVKLDAMTGSDIWHAVLDGAGTDANGTGLQQANALAADPRGDVVAAGMLNPVTGNFLDFTVVKLNGADGTDFVQLCGNGVIEGTETCDDGNAAAGDGCSATCQIEAGFLCVGEPSSCAEPVGVTPKKLVVVDKLAASGSAKTTFTAKDANVSKGTGTDPSAISASFTAAYANGAARGGFAVPAGAWLRNTDKVAKYVNKTAPAGPTQTKVALIRPASTLSLTAKGIGDTPFGIVTAGDPAGDVNTAYCVTNGGPTICHCSVNQNCVFTKVAGDTGAKLKCKGGVADPTCAALAP